MAPPTRRKFLRGLRARARVCIGCSRLNVKHDKSRCIKMIKLQHVPNVSRLILQILVEFDDATWETREWLNVYKDNFHLLAVEKNLVLTGRSGNFHPALSFKLLVDASGHFKGPKTNKVPVEFLSDLKIDFQDCNKLRVITVSIQITLFFKLSDDLNKHLNSQPQ